MASRPDDLYERDFYAWTREQARQLRRLAQTRPNVPVDFSNLIDEVESLGRSERNAARSHLRVIIEHCLKLEFSTAVEPRPGWQISIGAARTEVEDYLTPTIQRSLRRSLPRIYAQARREAERALRLHREHAAAHDLPQTCPYRLADLLRHDWLPASRHGLRP